MDHEERKHTEDRAAVLKAEHRERMVTNVILLLIFAVLVGIGYWISSGMLDARRADECISAGRRNCNPIDLQR